MTRTTLLDVADQSEFLVIKEAAGQIQFSDEPSKAITTILSLISRQMGLNRGRVMLKSDSGEALATVYAFGLTPEEVAQSRFLPNEGISGKVLRSGRAVIIPDIDQESDYLCKTVNREHLPDETVSFIATPVLKNNRAVGVLAVNRLKNRSRSLDKDLGLLQLIALFISEILAVYDLIAHQTQVLKEENEQLRSLAVSNGSAYGIIGESQAVLTALNKAARAANVSVTVLLKGESGTGKEKFARMLHLASVRQDGPFVAINCAAIPLDLLESELFGHEKGAFTGASQTKPGKIELANGGTLFLDEIGDMDLGLQAKLLRVLEERSITRLGSNRALPVDVRIVVASHKNLQQSVNEGLFRLDLFYRLNVFPIELPPLRERHGDIRLLARHFLNQSNQEYGATALFDRGALEFLESYTWPGNIRQLENVVKRSVLMADDHHLIGAQLMNDILVEEGGVVQATSQLSKPVEPRPSHNFVQLEVEAGQRHYWKVSDSEKDQLVQAFELAKGNKTRAAGLLNMTPRQFNYRWKKLGLG